MILSCPDCKTRYLVNPAQLRPDGRVVRCAKCGTSWKEEAPAFDPDEPAPLVDEPNLQSQNEPITAPPPYERPVRIRPVPPGSNLPAIHNGKTPPDFIGWLALIGFVAAILGSAYVFRSTIVATWPPAKKLYDILEIDAGPMLRPVAKPATLKKPNATAAKELLFQNLSATPRYDGDVLVLTFEGVIENPTGEAILPSTITAVAKNDKEADVKSWSFEVAPAAIAPHSSIKFSTELRGAPPETRRVIPVFVPKP